MISIEKVKLYKKYSGDLDKWSRYGSRREHKLMTDMDWVLIDDILQGLELIDKGLTSDSYKEGILEKMRKHCDGEKSIEALESLIGKF